jgi:hypothetical protein
VIQLHHQADGRWLAVCPHGATRHAWRDATDRSLLRDGIEAVHQLLHTCACERWREPVVMEDVAPATAEVVPVPETPHAQRVRNLLRYLEDVTRRLPALYDEVEDAERALQAAQATGQAKRQEVLQNPTMGLIPEAEREQHLYDSLLDERMAITRASDVLRSANKRLAVTQEMAANLRSQALLLALPGMG